MLLDTCPMTPVRRSSRIFPLSLTRLIGELNDEVVRKQLVEALDVALEKGLVGGVLDGIDLGLPTLFVRCE